MSSLQNNQIMATTNKVITILNKTDGRDKLGKAMQGLSRYLHFYYLNKDKDLADRFNGLSAGMRDARKLFRLFKTMNEIEKVIELSQKESNDNINKMMTIITRIFFGGYWFFDNLVVLITVKFLKSNKDKANKTSNTFWFLGLSMTILQSIRNIYLNFAKIAQLKVQGAGNEKNTQAIEALKAKNVTEFMKIIQCTGDLLAAGTGSKIFENTIGWVPNSGLIGLGGLTSASIAGYNMF